MSVSPLANSDLSLNITITIGISLLMGRPTRSYLYSIAFQMDPLDSSAMCACTSAPSPENPYLEFKPCSPSSEEHSILSAYYSHSLNHLRSHSRSYIRSVNLVEDSSSTNGRPPPIPFVDSDYDSEDDPFDPEDPDVVVERVLDPVLNRYAMLAREIIEAIRPQEDPELGRVGHGDIGTAAEPMDTDSDDDEEQNEHEESGNMDARVEYDITFSPAPRQIFEPSRNTLSTRLDQLPTLSAGSLSVPSSDDTELSRLGAPYTFSIFSVEREGDTDSSNDNDGDDGSDSEFD
ncbi:hypothetical protein [Phaffia rhodozyma]|uniref:Uncharacterized protein n=1 Tax=Phaffia rhodozyma TaxID=264483 RepID=A0A0F7SUT7_PHARH|nr:hypothetical protein [Phaffia rhodozyma]